MRPCMTLETICRAFARHGDDRYAREPVSQLEHALQSALLAEDEGAPDALIVAALLHDVGHLLEPDDAMLAARGIDARHEIVGADRLAPLFPPAVTEPVR